MRDEYLAVIGTGTHCGFCDESKYNIGRYRAVSIVSMPTSNVSDYNNVLEQILIEANIKELRWHDLSSRDMRKNASKATNYTVEYAKSGKLRVDTLIWDIEDNRHKILKRDDITNLQKMYYHLLRNVIINRWDEPAYWVIFPDEQTATNWEEFETILDRGIRKVEREMTEKNPNALLLKGILKISQMKSHKCAIIQIADLFAGLGVHSYESLHKHLSYYIVRRWRGCKHISPLIKDKANSTIGQFSRIDRERCRTLHDFHIQCKKNKWGIHLLRTKGLRTTMRQCPINFWLYTPQSEYDKAPVKQSQKSRQ